MNKRHCSTKNNSKKGFTLIELLVVIALIGILSVLLLDVITSVTRSYSFLREKSQAISLANDLLGGINEELKRTDTVYLGYTKRSGGESIEGGTSVDYGKGVQINKLETAPDYSYSAMQITLPIPMTNPPKDENFFDILSGRIYLSNVSSNGKKRGVIENDLGDTEGNCGIIKSKYYYGYQITGLKFDILPNHLINITHGEIAEANFAQICNILQVSFDIKSSDGKKVLFSVQKYNLYLDNLIANLYKNDLESGNGLSTGVVTWEDLGIYSCAFEPIDITLSYPKTPADIKNEYEKLEDLNVRSFDLLLFAPRSN